jgi:hypothetical protein
VPGNDSKPAEFSERANFGIAQPAAALASNRSVITRASFGAALNAPATHSDDW